MFAGNDDISLLTCNKVSILLQGFLTEGLRKTSAGLGSVSSLCCVTVNVECIGRE